jgi:hypothetical protein
MKRAHLRTFRLAHAAWLFGIFAFFIPAATWNPVSRFNLTRAIVEGATLQVDQYITSTGDRSLVNGRWYSDKAPVIAFLAVPPYAVIRATQVLRGAHPDYKAYSTPKIPAARVIPNKAFTQALYVCSLATSGVAGVAIGLLLFELLRRRTTWRTAFVASTIAILGSPLLPYATSLYGHVPAAALILAALVCLDPRGSRPRGATPSARRIRIAGACFALAAGTEYLPAVAIVLVSLWFLLKLPRSDKLRGALNLGAGAVVPAVLVATYQTVVFGAPWKTGYSYEERPEFAAGHEIGILGVHLPHWDGALGLTFGERRGLFYIAPVLLLGLILTVRYVARRKDWTVGAGLLVLGSLFFMNAGYYMWWGGASAGPRHLIPGLAFLSIGLVPVLRSKRRWLRWLGGTLAVISVANCVAITLVGIEPPEFADILRSWVWPRLRDARFASMNGASNLGLKLGLPPVASVLPLLAWGLVGYEYLLSQSPRSRR